MHRHCNSCVARDAAIGEYHWWHSWHKLFLRWQRSCCCCYCVHGHCRRDWWCAVHEWCHHRRCGRDEVYRVIFGRDRRHYKAGLCRRDSGANWESRWLRNCYIVLAVTLIVPHRINADDDDDWGHNGRYGPWQAKGGRRPPADAESEGESWGRWLLAVAGKVDAVARMKKWPGEGW